MLFLLLASKSLIITLFNKIKQASLTICREYSEVITTSHTDIMHHQRAWKNPKIDQAYCLEYELDEKAYVASGHQKEIIKGDSHLKYHEYWGEIYRQLHESDIDQLGKIIDSLSSIRLNMELSSIDFAHAVVKLVQDIPYSYVVVESCEEEHPDEPCLGYQKFGISTPIEFLYTLKGDCDSRTVLLYSLLSYFGYDPLVLISYEYRHSMLALNIPATGDYLEHRGRKYYFWETTGKNWLPGMIPPGMENKSYWKIALKNEH